MRSLIGGLARLSGVVLVTFPIACAKSTPAAPAASTTSTTTTTTTVPAGPADLTFVVDAGVRMENATNPAAGVGPSGAVTLYYVDQSANAERVSTASDGLAFAPGTSFATRANDSRRTQLPDGTWRLYQWDPRALVMRSQGSADGVAFAAEDGVRYAPQPADRGTLGVYDAFTDTRGGVVLLYIGDLMGLNNVRRAYSTDGGLTFAFVRGNVLGDDALGGGGQSYVDEKTIRLPDGRRRLFAMRGGSAIYSFISSDDDTFTQEAGTRITVGDLPNLRPQTVNDPVVVRLPDGRYRMYVAARATAPATRWVIVSATTP